MCFTVTKKARPKQSFDMNLKAWDNEAYLRVTVSAFVGFKDLWEIMAWCDKRFGVSAPTPSRCASFGFAVRFTFARNEGGLFGGERT